MNARTITISSIQVAAAERSAFESVWPQVCAHVVRAAQAGARLIVLPEGTVPAYVIGNAPVDSSITERALADIRAISRRTKTVIVYGSVRHEAGLQYNSAYVVDEGELAGFADKCFLWHFDRQWFAPGGLRAPIRTSIGALGVMICADGRIPTIARTLVDEGAEMLVMPTAWVTSGRDAANFENIQADLLAAVRARENNVPFVAANKCSVERGAVAYCGKSQIVDASGSVLALASQRDPETITAQVTLGEPRPSRTSLSHRPYAATVHSEAVRIALTPLNAPPAQDILSILEADVAVCADPTHDASAHERCGAVAVDDHAVMDPAGLVEYRLHGTPLFVWRTQNGEADWIRRLARARAVELRVYVICIAAERFAFAADPDGVIVCGTFDDFSTATFAFAPQRTQQTLVAPGTDVIEGLERARRIDVGL